MVQRSLPVVVVQYLFHTDKLCSVIVQERLCVSGIERGLIVQAPFLPVALQMLRYTLIKVTSRSILHQSDVLMCYMNLKAIIS